ncbi:MAG: DUF3488 domain-containing transglutaminase family protein [bacterium]|nr:DUF3488 domain-containing transglutaminase family protein [bacterium]
MSRLQFRASVEDPRPVAAWLMVTMAIATLAITGQIAPWAIAAAGTAALYSFFHRLAPRPWQRSPWFLNSAIVCIALLCVMVSLRGEPVTIALAHFAVLTQGLQLMDARPRKSEFLLVALALFQVVLAANLTDSVLFPPMLVLYLAATTWTLLVHTLRSEAIEAGDVGRPDSRLTAGLVRTTFMASAVSVLLALLIFTLLPRFRSSIIERGDHEGGAVAGFTDEVRLGTIGKIRSDPSVVLRIETIEGDPPRAGEGYWRGLAFDHFDGERWSVSPPMRSAPGGSPTFGIDLARAVAARPLVQRIVREPVTGGVLFSNGEARAVRGAIKRVEVDVNGSLYSPTDGSRRVRYTIRSESQHPSDQRLRGDRTLVPRLRPDAYLVLPETVPAVATLARRVTAGLETDADRVRAIETHLRSEGQYTDSPRAMNPALGASPVEGFLLGELSGHCEYFASGMVVLARSIGIPARLVNGFAGGQRNEMGDFVELTRADAHAWVEVHYEDAGWVRYDPTPPSLRTREDLPPNLMSRVGELASTIELWWYQRVVDFDTSDQVEMIRSTWLAWRALRDNTPGGGPLEAARDPSGQAEVNTGIAAILALGLLAALATALVRIRRPRRTRSEVPRTYARALALLRRRGLPRERATTARDYARQVETRVPQANARAFHAITDAYLAQRFGRAAPSRQTQSWKALRRGLPRRLSGVTDQSAP